MVESTGEVVDREANCWVRTTVSLEYGEKKMGTLPRVIPEGTVDYRMQVLKFTEDLFGCRKLESLNDIMAGEFSMKGPWELIQAS